METAIQYKSYLVRFWCHGVQGETGRGPLPEAEAGELPEWLGDSLGDGPDGQERDPRGGSGGAGNRVYAEVEPIQSGDRLNFGTLDSLLKFLSDETEAKISPVGPEPTLPGAG